MTMLTDKLLAKAAEYEQRANALRMAAEEMNGHAVKRKQQTAVSTLDAAIALRRSASTRRKPHPKPHAVSGRHTNSAKAAQRARTYDLLGHYDRTEPRQATEIAKQLGLSMAQMGLGPLVANGYLTKKKGGYVRSAKPYVIDESAANT